MDPLTVSAQFAAYVWFTGSAPGRAHQKGDALWQARFNPARAPAARPHRPRRHPDGEWIVLQHLHQRVERLSSRTAACRSAIHTGCAEAVDVAGWAEVLAGWLSTASAPDSCLRFTCNLVPASWPSSGPAESGACWSWTRRPTASGGTASISATRAVRRRVPVSAGCATSPAWWSAAPRRRRDARADLLAHQAIRDQVGDAKVAGHCTCR